MRERFTLENVASRWAACALVTVAVPAVAQDAAEDEALFQMEEIVVTGTASEERTKFQSSVGISTFDASDIERQAPTSTADLISAVPGFYVESNSGSTQGNVFARGIIQDGGYRYVGLLEDGIPIYPVFELSFYNPDQFVRLDETIERVEAVRGGTAPIFTSGAVGGTVNFVTRRPGDGVESAVKGTVGDFGLYRADLYWGGPVGGEWDLGVGGYYRVSDGVRDPGYRADEGGQVRFNLLRSFDNGELELFGRYIDDRSLFAVPVPLTGDPSDPIAADGSDAGEYSIHSRDLAAAGLPASAAEVGLQDSDLEDGIHPQLGTVGARFDWDFAGGMTLTNLFRYTDGDVRWDGIFTGDAPVTGIEFAAERGVAPAFTVLSSGAAYDPTRLVQNHGHWVIDKAYEAIQNDLRLGFELGRHELTVGAYVADYEMSDRWSLGNLLLMDITSRPSRLALPGVTDPAGFTEYSFLNLAADYDATSFALYASDEWQVTERFRLDLGVRYDDEDIDASISDGITVDLDGNPATPWDNETSLAGPVRTDQSLSFDNTSWSIGFNYDLNGSHAFFGHYTDSAKLPHFDDVRNGLLRNDEVTNLELGYKTSLDTVGLFLTLFQTKFDNVPFNDILADGSIVVREAATDTRGIELEGTYQPIDAFALQFAVTVQDPEYDDFRSTEIDPATGGLAFDNTGNRIRRIPETMVRLTPTYYFGGGRGQVYLTYTRMGTRFANDENTIRLPSYDKIDAGILWDVNDSVTVQLVADNLTDEVGLTEGNPRTDVGAAGVGAVFNARPLFGRSWRASGTFRF